MKEVASLNQELTIEERNLLSVAYKNIIVSRAFLYMRSSSPLPAALRCWCLAGWLAVGPAGSCLAQDSTPLSPSSLIGATHSSGHRMSGPGEEGKEKQGYSGTQD